MDLFKLWWLNNTNICAFDIFFLFITLITLNKTFTLCSSNPFRSPFCYDKIALNPLVNVLIGFLQIIHKGVKISPKASNISHVHVCNANLYNKLSFSTCKNIKKNISIYVTFINL